MNIEVSSQLTKEKIPTPKLRFAHLAPAVWQALADLPRTGWVRRGVENPESVQDHIVSLREIASTLEGVADEERSQLLDMLEVHDWPEAIHGDEVILLEEGAEKQRLKQIKFENEERALRSICEALGEKGKEIMRIWLRFEAAGDSLASLANQLDKYQAIEKALQYEQEQGIPLFKEFHDHSSKYISHPVLIKKLDVLMERWKRLTASYRSKFIGL